MRRSEGRSKNLDDNHRRMGYRLHGQARCVKTSIRLRGDKLGRIIGQIVPYEPMRITKTTRKFLSLRREVRVPKPAPGIVTICLCRNLSRRFSMVLPLAVPELTTAGLFHRSPGSGSLARRRDSPRNRQHDLAPIKDPTQRPGPSEVWDEINPDHAPNEVATVIRHPKTAKEEILYRGRHHQDRGQGRQSGRSGGAANSWPRPDSSIHSTSRRSAILNFSRLATSS